MYDFLDCKLLPKVLTETPSMENYEVTNLISEDYTTRTRGFIAYSTVKPPIEVTFELICPVNIHYIILLTSIGTQKCTAIELLSKKFNDCFVSIGYGKFNNNGIIFCNRRFYSVSNPPPNPKSFSLNFFKTNSYKSFTTANFVKVRILQTERSVPCLGKVEIWGTPSKLCSSATLETINRLVRVVNKSKENVLPSLKATLVPNDLEIPEEFKDLLTFEVMSIPLTLPSGKTVDKSTLEKFLANEALYGRVASDPFTGLPFTETRKPLFNSALKSRIDMFLLQNSEKPETFSIKRTLGRKSSNPEGNLEYTKKIRYTYNEDDQSQPVKTKDPDKILEEAINKTMHSREFIRFTTIEDVSIKTTKCSICSSTTNLYSVPCDHLYCRNCLLELGQYSNCTLCDKRFLKSDAKKFHY